MSRFLAQDIRDKMVNLLTSGGTDIYGNAILSMNDTLDQIDTKRSQTTPKPLRINYDWMRNQTPWVMIDSESSEIFNDEELTNNYSLIPEVYNVRVIFEIKGPQADLQNYAENYIESIINVLHGYSDSDITWILAIETEKTDLYQREAQFMKMGTVLFQVRIN